MAENPRFNNSGMFTNSGDNYSDIEPNSTSEVLATQGNVINSIKVFWNKLRAKLAYAVARPNYNDAVGGNYQPVYIDSNGVVQVCAPETIVASIESGSSINIGNTPIHPGKTICVRISGSLSASALPLKIGNDPIIYPSGASVYTTNVHSEGTYLFTYMVGGGNKWILISSMNVVDGTNPGLMTAAEHNKLANIAENANNYSLPIAGSNLGGVKSAATGNTAGRDYNVQINSDGTMKVNVPWTDTLPTHTTVTLSANEDSDKDTVLSLNDGENISNVKIKGNRGTSVYKGQNGEVVIDSANVTSYNTLTQDSLGAGVPVTVPYPNSLIKERQATRYLNALGQWTTAVEKLYIDYDQKTSLTTTIINDRYSGVVGVYAKDNVRLVCTFIVNGLVITGSGLNSNNLPTFGTAADVYIPYFPLYREDNASNPGYDTRYKPGVIVIHKNSAVSATLKIH